MKKIIKDICIFSLLFSLLLLSGCETKEEVYESESPDPTNITFSWWGNDVRHIYTLDGLSLFESKNPDIHVVPRYSVWNGYEKRIRAYMESHTEADIMQINYAWLDLFSPDGEGFYDLYELKDIIDLDTFAEEDLIYGDINGKLNAVPVSFNTYIVYHNQDIYESYGLELPKTWEDYFHAAEVMREDGIYPFGSVKKQVMFLLISYFEQTKGRQAFGDDGSFLLNEEDVEYILEFYRQLIDEKVLMPPADFERSVFNSQKTASTLAWVTDAKGYCESMMDAGIQIAIGDYPSTENPVLPGRYIKPSCMYAISKNTENPKETARFLQFLINSWDMIELQGLEKGVPAGKNAVASLNRAELLDGILYDAHLKMQDDQQFMRLIVPAMELEPVIDAFKQGADEYLFDKTDIHTCASKICKDINEIVEDMK